MAIGGMFAKNPVQRGVLVAALVSVVVAAGVVAVWQPDLSGNPDPEVAITSADLSGRGPGSLVRATTMPQRVEGILTKNATTARVLYRSTDAGTGLPTEVTGSAFSPTGTPPSGGWPVVALGHAATGIQTPCAPSLSANLLGEAPVVRALLASGYAVAVTDYQGLGADGVHPFLDAQTAGYNLVDSVRALRATFPDVSTRWIAMGTGQGGAAAWAASEQASSYGSGLQLVGAMSMSPTADVTGLADDAGAHTLTKDRALLLQWVVASLEQRSELSANDFRRGQAAQQWEELSACSGPLTLTRAKVVTGLDPDELSADDATAADELRASLRAWSLPKGRAGAPLLVTYDVDDPALAPEWTAGAIRQACALGSAVDWRTTSAVSLMGFDQRLSWAADRFANRPMRNSCDSATFGAPDAGSIVEREELDNPAVASTGALGARVLYRSTEGDTGGGTVVSAAVFAPVKTPPEGGWPVIAVGHGTTGINQECAPSLSANLSNQDGVVASLLNAGFAVALADYQGLGADGVHPYLDSRTAGLNIIESVRALRAAFPGVSNRWGAVGTSQGAGAVWAADEEAGSYAPELKLVGAVVISPTSNMSGLVDKAMNGTLTKDQTLLLQASVESLGRLHPDLDLDSYRRGLAAQNWDALSACSGSLAGVRAQVGDRLQPSDVAPASPQAAERLRTLLQQWALPKRAVSAPMSVVYGTDDSYIDAQWTTTAIGESCALGSSVAAQLQPGKGHADVNLLDQMQWLSDRFARLPLTAGCGVG